MSYDFFLDLAIIMVAAKLFGILFRKIHIPQVVGEIVAGLIIGPNVLGIVHTSEFLVKMAELGVIMLMFVAGLETDLKELKRTGGAALLIASMGVLVPLFGGYLLYSAFNGFAPAMSEDFYKAVFIGVIITATSVGITVETLREMGRLKGKVGTTILSAAIIDDVIGIILLTFVVGMKDPSVNPASVLINTALFFAFAVVVGVVCYYIFKWMDKRYPHKRRVPIYGFALCLAFAYIAEKFFGIADITGAYLAGIVLCNVRSSEYIVEKVDVNSYMMFGPVFFASIGLKTEIKGMTPTLLMFAIALVAVALLTKIVGCGLAARVTGFNNNESMKIGVGMMTRGEVALIVGQKGLAVGLLEPVLFSAIILLIIISSIVTPIVLKVLYRKDPPSEEGQPAPQPAVAQA